LSFIGGGLPGELLPGVKKLFLAGRWRIAGGRLFSRRWMMKIQHTETWERAIDRRARLLLPTPRLDYRPVEERISDFKEACMGFDPQSARLEASRCIQCPEPQACILACPLHNDIPSAMWEISQGNFIAAAQIYRQTNPFPELCGRLCPDDVLCAGSCGVGKSHASVRLGRLEAFVADFQRHSQGLALMEIARPSGKKVAIVGSGPAGLAAAEQLARCGHQVMIFEKNAQPGGALAYAIPRFRLPIEIVEDKIAQLEQMGVGFVQAATIGKDLSVDDLQKAGYQAILLCSGAGAQTDLELAGQELAGQELAGVFSAAQFLMQTNLGGHYWIEPQWPPLQIGEKVVIFGWGHAAVDCARTAIRLGARQVICLYPTHEMEMLCRQEDKLAAMEEGVLFQPYAQPVRLIGYPNGQLQQVVCQRMIPKCVAGERKSVPLPQATFELPADNFISALELGPDKRLAEAFPGLDVDENGWLRCHPITGATNLAGVFAAGDNTSQQHLAAFAIAEALGVASHIDQYLNA
jgi:glutamate synthase (NADPH/NADH) small chain